MGQVGLLPGHGVAVLSDGDVFLQLADQLPGVAAGEAGFSGAVRLIIDQAGLLEVGPPVPVVGEAGQAGEAVGRIQRLLFLEVVGVGIGGDRLERERAAHLFGEGIRRHVVVRHALSAARDAGRNGCRQIVGLLKFPLCIIYPLN